MIKKFIVITFSLMGVVALLLTIVWPDRIVTLLCLVFFVLALLEEKTDLMVVKVASRIILSLCLTVFSVLLVSMLHTSQKSKDDDQRALIEEALADREKEQQQGQQSLTDTLEKLNEAVRPTPESPQAQQEYQQQYPQEQFQQDKKLHQQQFNNDDRQYKKDIQPKSSMQFY